MDESSSDKPQTPQVTEKAEDEGGKGTQSISSIRQTPEVTEKTEDEGGNPGSSQPPEIANDEGGNPGSSQPPEIANDEGGNPGSSQPPQSNNVPQMFPLRLFHRLPDGSENIESKLTLDRQCNFEELVKNMKDDTTKIREWYDGVERRLSESKTELVWMMDGYSEEDLGWMMARSGLLLLEFLRFLADLRRLRRIRRSSNEFFESRDRHRKLSEAVIKIDNLIPIFVLKKILEWERDADKDENRLGSDGDADKDKNRGCIQIKMKTGDADGDADKDKNRGCIQIKMKTGDADKDENRGCIQIKMKTGDADTDLHSILKHAWPELSPIKYDSHEIAGVPLKDDSHLLEFVYENIIGSPTSDATTSLSHKRNLCMYWRTALSHKRRHDITLPQAEWPKVKGVKFARNEGLLKNIRFDIRNRTLYLPAIEMEGGTDAVLRNLVLFEQGKESQPLMSYVNFLVFLNASVTLFTF